MNANASSATVKTACRPCPVCQETQVETLRHQPFALPEGHLLPAAFDVVCCPRCGFCYADTPAAQEIYDRYYAEFSKYADNRTSTGGGGSPTDAQRLRESAEQLAEFLGGNCQSSVLDIGCSNGGLLASLRALGFTNLTGVDPSPVCVANTSQQPGLRAVVGTLTAPPPELGRYDLVVLSHVLEHVLDLQTVVAPLAALLNPGGRLYVEVPDAARYTAFVTSPFQDFNVEHINHFDLASLERLFATNGLALEAGGSKDLPVAQGLQYPAVYGFFRHAPAVDAPPKRSAATPLRDELRAYIVRSQELMGAIERTVAPLAAPGAAPILVWGTGQLAMKLLVETSLRDATVAAFVDGNPVNQGHTLRGVPVLAPAALRDLPPYPVLITTQLHRESILATLRGELGLANPAITL